VSDVEVECVGVIETAVAERAPTLTIPRKREREDKQNEMRAGKRSS
jgi:hypothetical protein